MSRPARPPRAAATAEARVACVACREPILAGATKCPHCGAPQRPERWRLAGTLAKWIGGATAVISLVIGAASVTQLYVGWRDRGEAVDQLLAAAKLEFEAQDYEGGWSLLDDALKLDPSARAVREFQVPFAMAWLRNIRVPADRTFSSVVDRLLPVLYRGAADPDKVRAADVYAHIGWANYLKWRDGDRLVDVELPYRRALALDSVNPFAHVAWGHWLLNRRDGGDVTEATVAAARAHFAAALRSGREGGYVATLAALAWLDSPYAHGTGEALRFANEARGAGRPVPAAVRARLMRAFRPLAEEGGEPAARKLLAGFAAYVPERELAPLYAWLGEGVAPPSGFGAVERFYVQGRLAEAGGDRAGALATYRALLAGAAAPYDSFVERVLNPAIARVGG